MLRSLERSMKFLLQNHSSYARNGDRPGLQRPQWAYAPPERADNEPTEVGTVERSVIDEIIHEQEQTGIDIITDGQVGWHDPISHFMGALEGVRINGLQRYFDTQFYFRQPVITAALRRRNPLVCGDFVKARHASRLRVKPVLPGPYTLARLCMIESGPYATVTALAVALSEIVAAEVSDLAREGAQIIQLEEPAILSRPTDIRLLRHLLEPAWDARGSAELMVATYFGDAEPLYAQLNSLPADVLALDFTCSPKLAEAIASTGSSKVLALGLIDGRNTRLEDPHAVASQIETILKQYVLDTAHLLPSCGLGHLPRNVARAKLELLARTRQQLHVFS